MNMATQEGEFERGKPEAWGGIHGTISAENDSSEIISQMPNQCDWLPN